MCRAVLILRFVKQLRSVSKLLGTNACSMYCCVDNYAHISGNRDPTPDSSSCVDTVHDGSYTDPTPDSSSCVDTVHDGSYTDPILDSSCVDQVRDESYTEL